MSALGRAVGRGRGIRVPGRGRAVATAGPSMPGIIPGGDRTPSPEQTMMSIMQKSPPISPHDGSTPEESPSGSPKRHSSPIAQLEALILGDKGRPDVRVVKSYGNEGTSANVEVNYVKVTLGEKAGPFIYHVRFIPDIDSIYVRRKIMRKNQKVVAVIGDVQDFTGMNLYLPKVLPNRVTEIITHHPEDTSREVRVVVEYLKKPAVEELIPFYNTLLRRAMQELKLVQIRHHYFMPSEKIAIPEHKLEVWPGSISKIVELDGGLLLCCEITHRVMRTSTALQVLQDLYRSNSSKFVENAKKQLVGCVVLTRYNNKPYRIDDIAFNMTPDSMFTKSDGSMISYVQYFRDTWNETVTDMRQPILINSVKPRKGETETRNISLIPEFCFMTGLTDDIRSDYRAMKDIAAHTRIRPEVRHAKLMQYLQGIAKNPSALKVFQDWNIKLDNEPYVAPARTFPNEVIRFGKNRVATVKDDVSWVQEATGTECFASFNLTDWIIIFPQQEDAQVTKVFDCLQLVTKAMGFKIQNPKKHPILDDGPATYVKAIRASVTPTTQLAFILTPGAIRREDRYNAIKKLTCCEMSVPSQVVRCATVSDKRKIRSVCQKVALQMQCKIGGQPWTVPIPFKSAMFVGIDVYHDPNRQAKSCVAIVASMNAECSRWYSRVFFQGTSEEIAHSLQSGLKQCAKKFAETTGVFPNKVFVYRDGVGDGQIPVVQDYEVPQMKAALAADAPSETKLSTIIVQKRVDTRMILKKGENFYNPKSGTVLDRVVTRLNFQDFFLISQHVNEGTVTPTHYIVADDEIELSADKMQRLTYRMTFLYYNWPGCVRVPAPCQYAHKIAYLAGQNLAALPQDSICDKLFFL